MNLLELLPRGLLAPLDRLPLLLDRLYRLAKRFAAGSQSVFDLFEVVTEFGDFLGDFVFNRYRVCSGNADKADPHQQ